MLSSLPPFAREQFEATFTRPLGDDAPSRDDSPPPTPDSTPARPESVPAFVVIWEWQR